MLRLLYILATGERSIYDAAQQIYIGQRVVAIPTSLMKLRRAPLPWPKFFDGSGYELTCFTLLVYMNEAEVTELRTITLELEEDVPRVHVSMNVHGLMLMHPCQR